MVLVTDQYIYACLFCKFWIWRSIVTKVYQCFWDCVKFKHVHANTVRFVFVCYQRVFKDRWCPLQFGSRRGLTKRGALSQIHFFTEYFWMEANYFFTILEREKCYYACKWLICYNDLAICWELKLDWNEACIQCIHIQTLWK